VKVYKITEEQINQLRETLAVAEHIRVGYESAVENVLYRYHGVDRDRKELSAAEDAFFAAERLLNRLSPLTHLEELAAQADD
jgi:hypothetical protein